MRPRSPGEAADRFHDYLKEWILQQRAEHGEDVAKERLRIYMDGVVDSIRVVGEFGPDGLCALQWVIAMVQTNALSVQCPDCGAEIGDLCWSSTRVGGKLTDDVHHDRRRAARGEYIPQRMDTWLARRRQQVTEEAAARAAEAVEEKKQRGWTCK